MTRGRTFALTEVWAIAMPTVVSVRRYESSGAELRTMHAACAVGSGPGYYVTGLPVDVLDVSGEVANVPWSKPTQCLIEHENPLINRGSILRFL